MDNKYPPYVFLDTKGKAQGILLDQWALWEKRTGISVDLLAIPWKEALDGMKAGQFEMQSRILRRLRLLCARGLRAAGDKLE